MTRSAPGPRNRLLIYVNAIPLHSEESWTAVARLDRDWIVFVNEANQKWEYALDKPGSAGPATIRRSAIFATVMVVVVALIATFGDIPLPPYPSFTIFHAFSVFLINIIVAFLLFGQFVYRRLPSYCILATAFLTIALIAIPYLLCFPGAFLSDRQLMGGEQSAAWAWTIWHILPPAIIALSLALYASSLDRPMVQQRIHLFIIAAVIVAVLLVLLITAAITIFHDDLPVIIVGDQPLVPNFNWGMSIAAATTVIAFVMAMRLARRRTILHVWLAVVLLALLADVVGAFTARPRYTLGWYFIRIDWMVAGGVLLVIFLTDINRLYLRLGAAMHRLSALVAEKDAMLVQLRENEKQLHEVDKRKDAFIATLAHELRNPLAPLNNAARLLAHDPERDVVQWSAGIVARQVAQMARLLDDLLDIARIKHNRLELRRTRVSLQEVLDAACEQSRPLLDGAKQDLHLDLPVEHIYINGDKARLAQVFANLLNNAARYTSRPGKVTVDAHVEAGEVVVRVKDNGIGMAPEALGSIFEMFYQWVPADRGGNGGVGLGLPLVKGLVELHGGSVTARSEGLGKGSEFTIRLPALTETGAATPSPTVHREAATTEQPLRVLVVDDNHDNTDSMQALLTILGHYPSVAYRAHEALAQGPNVRPHVVLLDIGLPDMTGYECAALIRETEWGRDAFLIAMTGWGKTEDKQRAFEAGFDEHLTKPIDLDRLEKILAGRTGSSRLEELEHL